MFGNEINLRKRHSTHFTSSKAYGESPALYAGLVTLIWWPAILFTLYTYFEYAQRYIFLAYARSLGLSNSSELSNAQILLVFSETCLLLGVVVPVATYVISYFIRSKFIPSAVLSFVIAIIVLNYTNMLSIANTGSLMTWRLLIDSAVTASKEPELAGAYVSTNSLIKLLLLLLSACAVYAFAMYAPLRRKLPLISGRPALVLTCLVLCVFPVLLLYAKLASGTRLEPGIEFLSKQVSTMLDQQNKQASVLDGLGLDEATRIFQDHVGAPMHESHDRLFDAERGSNLLLIILESGSAQFVDYKNSDSFENLRLLAENGVTAKRHHSTYPYTSDALFSIFTSLYPNELRPNLFNVAIPGSQLKDGNKRIGFFNSLSDAGYQIKMYLPEEPLFESDDTMFAALGVSEIYFPPENSSESEDFSEIIKGAVESVHGYENMDSSDRILFEKTYGYDALALDKMLSDIRQNAQSGESFASVFLPQFGHGPWPDLSPLSTLAQTGQDIFSLQDKWIGKILQTLEETGIVENTVVVVTADHGLRTSAEYPGIEPGVLNDVSFRVPMIISAPGTFKQTITIEHVTSHIDIAPSILSLLGVHDPSLYTIGSPFWASGLDNRRTYLLADSYLGVDGYHTHGNFSMYHGISETTTVSESLFTLSQAWEPDSLSADATTSVRQNLDLQLSFQLKLKDHFLELRRSNFPDTN